MTVETKAEIIPPRADLAHLNVYQRLALVQSQITVRVTGKNEKEKPAISIQDTERALRDLLVENGIVTVWGFDKRESYVQPTRSGQMTMWHVSGNVRVVNADKAEDFFSEPVGDVGTNPSAAMSFARKGFYKSLFHIAEKDDDKIRDEPNSRVPHARNAPMPPPPIGDNVEEGTSAWRLGGECPVCGSRIGGTRTALKCTEGHTPERVGNDPDPA